MLKPRILITGITGFVGGHLLNSLRAAGYGHIWGLIHRRHPSKAIPRRNVQWVRGDLCDQVRITTLLKRIKPDWIFHLAGQAVVSVSWAQPRETLKLNAEAQISLFEAIREAQINPRILVVCSSEEYGLVKKEELPVTEHNLLRPLSPYAVSKAVQDLLAFQYYKSYALQTIRIRAFNHTGPRRPPQYAVSSFAQQIARIEHGEAKPVVQVGNLLIKRDYMDVRDMAAAYIEAIKKGVPGEVYNICSGKPRSLEEILKMLLTLSSAKIRVVVDPARFRPSDSMVIYGNASKFRRLTGWRPQIPLRTTLADILDYWRKFLRVRK
jgi:GDP-4-dehydro-6-deoxy-D-mannose reductase